MNSPAQQIKERLSIEDVVSSYIKLDASGANLKARCPFHNEKTPSFFVSPSRGSYYCFGCGASGDIFTFVEEFEGLDFKGALKLLADRAGVALNEYTKEESEREGEKEKIFRAMEESARYYGENLNGNKEVLDYLKKRGLNLQSIQDFRIGFAVPEWRLLFNYLKTKGFSDEIIEKAGLAKKTDKGMYDRFRGRIMFPINDTSGRVIAFSGRLFEDDGKSAKYLNSPDTPIFSKSAVLYGLDKAKESIRKNNFSILVEGQMDLILSHQAGYKNTIATSGTALSDSTVSKENAVSNLGLIRRLSPNIVLSFDGDKAGLNASNRAARIALSLGMDVKIASMPEGIDPADLIATEGADRWQRAIKDSKHIIEFLLEKFLKDSDNDLRKAGREIRASILPYVDALESSIEKMHFIKKISDESGIPISALKDDLKKIEQELKFEKREIEEAEESLSKEYRKDYILRKLLGIVLWQKTLEVPSSSDLDADRTLGEIARIVNLEQHIVIEKTRENQEDLIFEAEVFYGKVEDLEKDIRELLSNLEEEYLKEELMLKMRDLQKAESGTGVTEPVLILREINELNNRIQKIKSGR